jgi:TolB-like protein
LWGEACYDTGRQSLRRALADIKAEMGEVFGDVITATNTEITLDLSRVSFIGPRSGVLLEGIGIREPDFVAWLEGLRQSPGQLDSLFSVQNMALGRAALPVLAILPFRALEPQDAALGDWLAEDLARNLSRARVLNVISHLSSRQLAGRTHDIAAVRDVLQATYCVVGSVRRHGDGVTLDADLIEVRGGQILMTRRIRSDLPHLMEVPSEVLGPLIEGVAAAIADDALRHIAGVQLSNIEDHRLLIAGVSLMHRLSLVEFARSRELIDEACRRAPHVAEVHAWLGKWHVLSVFNRWSADVAGDTQAALDATARALDLSPDNAFSLTIDGFAHTNLLRRMDVAEKRYERARQRNPNESLAWLLSGTLSAFRDQPDEAVEAVELARQLSPIDPFEDFYDSLSAGAHLAKGNLDHALALADRALAHNDRQLSTHRVRITILHEMGRAEEARQAAQMLLMRQPDMSVSSYLQNHPSADFEIGRRVATALRASGIG